MKPRMLCTGCGETAHADTAVEGSDAIEMVGWLCGAVPGWLLCGWRWATRLKVCAFCGSEALVREARAAAARRLPDAPSEAGAGIRNLSGPMRWPVPLASPCERLRRGAPGALLGLAAAATQGLAVLGLASLPAAMAPALAASAAGWLLYQLFRVVSWKAGAPRCRAWDANGRSLRIEVI